MTHYLTSTFSIVGNIYKCEVEVTFVNVDQYLQIIMPLAELQQEHS